MTPVTSCDFCPDRPASWLLFVQAPGLARTAVACRDDVDRARRVLSRIAPPTIVELAQQPAAEEI